MGSPEQGRGQTLDLELIPPRIKLQVPSLGDIHSSSPEDRNERYEAFQALMLFWAQHIGSDHLTC
jgi:hypothetical protein